MRRRRFERDPTILLYPMYIYAYTGTLCVLAANRQMSQLLC